MADPWKQVIYGALPPIEVCCCLDPQVNEEIVSIQRVRTAAGEAQLKQLIQDHVERTGDATKLSLRP